MGKQVGVPRQSKPMDLGREIMKASSWKGDASLHRVRRCHAMNAIEPPPQMLRLCAACAPFMPNAQA